MEIDIKYEIKYMKSMMDSCYAYDSLSKDDRYLAKYKTRLGEETFNKVYAEHKDYLIKTFKVIRGTYTDHEGLTYNSLEKI